MQKQQLSESKNPSEKGKMPPACASEIISPKPGLMSYNGGDMDLRPTPAMILYVQR